MLEWWWTDQQLTTPSTARAHVMLTQREGHAVPGVSPVPRLLGGPDMVRKSHTSLISSLASAFESPLHSEEPGRKRELWRL